MTIDLTRRPEDAKLRPTYVVVDLQRLSRNLAAIRARVRLGQGHADPQGQRLRPRHRGRRAPSRPRGRRDRRGARRGGHRAAPHGHHQADPGDGRHVVEADPALHRARPDADGPVPRPPERRRGGGRRPRPAARGFTSRSTPAWSGSESITTTPRGCSRPPFARATSRSRGSTRTSRTPTPPTCPTPASSSSASPRSCASTSAARCRPRSATSPTRRPCCACPESHLDMVRPGLLLYGVYPSRTPHAGESWTVDVAPALSWRSRVVYFKVVEAGQPRELRLDLAERSPRPHGDGARSAMATATSAPCRTGRAS